MGQRHPGNVEYRRIVRDKHKEYESKPGSRDDIANDVIQIIKSQGGRFLKQVAVSSSSGQLPTFCWVQSPDSLVRSKVKQALRDTGRQASLKASPRRSVNYAQTSSRHSPTSASAKGKNFGPTASLHRNDSVQQDESTVTLKSASATSRQNTGLGSSIRGDNSAQGFTPWSPPASGAAAVGTPAVQIPWTSSDQLGNVIHESSQRIKSLVMGSASASSLKNQTGQMSPHVVESSGRVAGVGTAVPMTTREVLQRYAMQELDRGPGDPSHLSASEIFELQEELRIVTRSTGNQASKPPRFPSNRSQYR